MNSTMYSRICVIVGIICSGILFVESKTMNDQIVSNNTSSKWLDYINKTIVKKSGQLIATDAMHMPVIIDWYVTNIVSPDIAIFKKEVSDLAAYATAAVEVQLLHKYPQAVSSGGFLKACEPFFAQGADKVDWKAVTLTLEESIKQFYLMDLSKFGGDIINKLIDDIYFFASIKDQETNALLGFIMTSITPALPYGDVKVINVVVAPENHNRGLEALLLSSVFKVIPEAMRLFTVVRPTHDTLLKAYRTCGLQEDHTPIVDPNHRVDMEYLIALEYNAAQTDVLQKVAQTLTE